jgi:hypothetical protein
MSHIKYPLPVTPFELVPNPKRTKRGKLSTAFRVYYIASIRILNIPDNEISKVKLAASYNKEDRLVKETCQLISNEANKIMIQQKHFAIC